MKDIVYINKQSVYEYPQKTEKFSPSENYPEYSFGVISKQKNPIYDMIRESFYALGYDSSNFGKKEWNPLGEFIKKGYTVLIKPNMVLNQNDIKDNGTDCLITNASLVRAVADYALIALAGTGRLIIGDAPLQSCDFDKLIKEQGYEDIIEFYSSYGISVELSDFRNYVSEYDRNGILQEKAVRNNSSTVVDLKSDSAFSGISETRYKGLRVTNYPPDIMYQHHNSQKNEYLVAEQILISDCIINMPKPKTHRKAGITGALKNLIGINANKEWLPHHTISFRGEKGDDYKGNNPLKYLSVTMLDIKNSATKNKRLKALFFSKIAAMCSRLGVKFGDSYFEGSWYGNDTIWRTIADLNKIIFYADKKGKLCDIPQRKMLIVGDMIVSGEKEGPLCPVAKNVGMILIAQNPVTFDYVVSQIMGFDYKKIPSINNLKNYKGKYNLQFMQEIGIHSNDMKYNGKINKPLNFEPTSGWKGHIEKT